MNSIITDILTIIKANPNKIKRELALSVFFLHLFNYLFSLALQALDQELVAKSKAQGFKIDKFSERSIITMLGEVRYKRRRYITKDKQVKYPLDEYMGWHKYQRYSLLVVRNINKLATLMPYRRASEVINDLSNFCISHYQLNRLVIKTGNEIAKKQSSANQTCEVKTKQAKPVLYLEGDGVVFKGIHNRRIEFHRYQLCEGVEKLTPNRQKRIHAKDFTSMNRLEALVELSSYLTKHYDLRKTVIISNADGGKGYSKADFNESCFTCLRHEHFLDTFHINKKVKDRLSIFPELQGRLIKAIEYKYDYQEVEAVLDTAESKLIDEYDNALNHENIARLRAYIQRHWEDMKPWNKRNLAKIKKSIGSCESNHRRYTYRMKGQGKYWTVKGSEAMLRIIACLKNKDLDYWLDIAVETEKVKEELKECGKAIKEALKGSRKAIPHLGIRAGKIESYSAGNSYLSRLGRALS